jgi:hypothetical protein
MLSEIFALSVRGGGPSGRWPEGFIFRSPRGGASKVQDLRVRDRWAGTRDFSQNSKTFFARGSRRAQSKGLRSRSNGKPPLAVSMNLRTEATATVVGHDWSMSHYPRKADLRRSSRQVSKGPWD